MQKISRKNSRIQQHLCPRRAPLGNWVGGGGPENTSCHSVLCSNFPDWLGFRKKWRKWYFFRKKCFFNFNFQNLSLTPLFPKNLLKDFLPLPVPRISVALNSAPAGRRAMIVVLKERKCVCVGGKIEGGGTFSLHNEFLFFALPQEIFAWWREVRAVGNILRKSFSLEALVEMWRWNFRKLLKTYL